MTAAVDICNIALLRLGAGSISSLLDDSEQARECSRIYDFARRSELRAYAWNFAKTRASLAEDSTTPAFGYGHRYKLPTDFLRLLPDQTDPDWSIEGNYILANDAAPLQIQYIGDVTDANLFDSLFEDLLTARIARDLAEPRTQKTSKIEAAEAKYKDIALIARKLNSFENRARSPQNDTWVTARI